MKRILLVLFIIALFPALALADGGAQFHTYTGTGMGSAHPSSLISFIPYGTVTATNIQAALQQIIDTGGGGGTVDTIVRAWLAAHTAEVGINDVHGSTASNEVNAIVRRDASGNFSAGTISANLVGNASTASALSSPMSHTDLTDKGTMTHDALEAAIAALTGGTGMTESTVEILASEQISAGDIVSSINSRAYQDGKNFLKFSAEGTFAAVQAQSPVAVLMSGTTFVVAFSDSTNSTGSSVAGKLNADNTVTWGTPVSFNAGSVSDISITRLSNTRYAIAFRDVANSNIGTAIVGTLSGTTIQYLASEATYSSGNATYNNCLPLDDDQFTIVYKDSTGFGYIVQATVNTTEGAVSFTSPDMATDSTTADSLVAVPLGTTKVAFAYATTPNGRMRVATLGGTITYGTVQTFSTADPKNMSMSAMSSSYIVISYTENAASNRGMVMTGFVPLTAFTFSTATEFDSASLYSTNVCAMNANNFVISYVGAPSTYKLYSRAGDINLNLGDTIVTNNGISFQPNVLVVDTTRTMSFYKDFDDSSKGNYAVSNIGIPTTSVIGVAKTSAAYGASVEVLVNGVYSAYSSLTPGSIYFVTSGFQAQTTPVLLDGAYSQIGVALSTTDMYISPRMTPVSYASDADVATAIAPSTSHIANTSNPHSVTATQTTTTAFDGNLSGATNVQAALELADNFTLGGGTSTAVVTDWTDIQMPIYRTDNDTFTIADNATSQVYIKAGYPIKYNGKYGLINSFTDGGSTLTVELCGAPLTTSLNSGLTFVGLTSKVRQLNFSITGYFCDAADTTLIANDLLSAYKWDMPKSYLVKTSIKARVADSGASNSRINVTLGTSDVLTANSNAGLTVATSWVNNTSDINTSNYDVNFGDTVEIKTDANGSKDDAQDLTVQMTFVLE